MNEEILRLIYNYSSNGKIADNYFIEKIVNIIVHYEQLNKYINKIEYIPINNFDKSSVAGYKYSEKKVIIFYKELNNYINMKKSTDVLVSQNEQLFYKNIEIVDCILHELEHAKQSKIMENDNTLESDILKLTGVGKSRELIALQLKKIGLSSISINNFLEEKLNNYYKYYDFAPHERLAEINSHSKMTDILYPIKNLVPNIYNLENILIVRSKLMGYTLNNKLISPTMLYLMGQGEENNLKKFPWYDNEWNKCLFLSKINYNKDTRIRLGLPIDNFEYSGLNRRYNKLVKSL